MLRRRSGRHTQSHAAPAIESIEQRVLLSGTGTPAVDFAAIDGSGNNVENPDWGSAHSKLARWVSVEYADGLSDPAGENRPSARDVSNALAAVRESDQNDRYLTDMLWIWGQFIDHDLDLSEGGDGEYAGIEVSAGDPWFDPTGSGEVEIPFTRTGYEIDAAGVRQQFNAITAFLDGSVVYGSDDARAAALRTFEGGLLKTSDGDLLPWNEDGYDNAGGTADTLFLAGDVRANENIALTAMHTVWVREHNQIAAEIASEDPSLTDEDIYQQARAIVRAELQAITYNEYLPALLGHGAVDVYQGYDQTANPNIANVFSTAAYRFGHSLLSPELLRLNSDGTTADEGNIALQSAFFRPDELVSNGVDSILRGAAVNVAQELDNEVVDDVRNFLFGPPGSGGFDLAALNIQRGRDHGLADYNQARVDLGLAPVTSFLEITSDVEVAAQLETVYGSVDKIDLWVGGLAEDHLPGSSMGETFTTVLVSQFEALRDGDRYWYQNILDGRDLQQVENTTLADVIERNTNIEGLQKNIFFAPSVLYVDLTDSRSRDVVLREVDGTVQVIDDRSRAVLASMPAEAVERVMLIGSGTGNDHVTISSISAEALPGGIVTEFGESRRDNLEISGSSQADVILVGETFVEVNGLLIEQTGAEEVVIRGGRGNDTVDVLEDSTAGIRIFGGSGADQLFGGSGHDRIFGGAGNDRIDGRDGNDVLFGHTGNDRIYGRSGDDRLFGQAGRDVLHGGRGNDTLRGGASSDLLSGGRGDDELIGGAGRDRIDSQLENDALFPTVNPHQRPGLDALFDDERLFG